MTQQLADILREPASDALERFLAAWYGRGSIESAGRQRTEPMPAPLSRFYALIGDRPEAIVQNVVLLPPSHPNVKRSQSPAARVDDEKLIFYVENQGVCEWATSLGEADDAPVWIRGSTLGGELAEWALEEAPLSAFLLEVLVFEAIMGASHGVSVAWLERRQLARVLGPLERLALGSWRWPSYPSEFYVGARLLAFAGANPGSDEAERTSEHVSLTVGALDAEALAYLDDLAQPEWEWFSRDNPASR